MATYALNTTSDAALIASIEAGMTDAGIITTTHYNTSPTLIVTTTRSNKVIKITSSSMRLQFYYGDAYVSGTTISNQVTVMDPLFTGGIYESVMVITDKILYFGYRQTSILNVLFGRFATEAQEYFVMSWVNDQVNWGISRDTTNDVQVIVITLQRPNIYTSGGNYYMVPLLIVSTGYVLVSAGVQGLYSLCRGWITSSTIQVYGDDVGCSGGGNTVSTSYYLVSFLIENGDSWAPA